MSIFPIELALEVFVFTDPLYVFLFTVLKSETSLLSFFEGVLIGEEIGALFSSELFVSDEAGIIC